MVQTAENRPNRTRAAFAAVLADERLGYIRIIQEEHQPVGHLVLTLKYTMEYGGMVACLDDLYVKPAWRNRGLSTAALLEVKDFCEKAGIRPSMGSVGDCYDNAMCESFNATLECELLAFHRFRTHRDAAAAIFDFIEGWYNPHRKHSALGYLSPNNFERRMDQAA